MKIEWHGRHGAFVSANGRWRISRIRGDRHRYVLRRYPFFEGPESVILWGGTLRECKRSAELEVKDFR